MKKRLGTVSVFIKSKDNIQIVNGILSSYSSIIISRTGLPYSDRDLAIIVLIVDGTNDEIGAMTGKLGNIKDVSVKAAISKM